MENIRFADTNNTGAAETVLYTVPNSSTLRRMFEGGGTPRFRLTSSYINLLRGGVSRALVRPNLALTFAYSSPDVVYHDADPLSATYNGIAASTQWLLYFNSDQSQWLQMPNGQLGSITVTWIPPLDYSFVAGDELYFFATVAVDQDREDPFKNFLKP